MASNKRRPVIGNLVSSSGHNRSSPLKILSPTGIINSDLAVVGLAIVAALQNTSTSTSTSTSATSLNQPPKHHHHHHPTNFFYDDVGGESESESESESERKAREMCVFDISPTIVVDHHMKGKCYPPPDFLTCCHLCNKKLHGKDIYMYRGEKAFCSIECRSRKMRMDENHHNITQVVSARSSQSQSQSHAHILSTGIFAL